MMIQTNELPEYLDAAVLRKIEKEKTKKEFYIFAALCSERDRDLLISDEELNIRDFERLQYLMCQLGFDSLRNSFLEKHADLLEELGNRIEKAVENQSTDIDMELEQYMKWDKDFIDQLPTENQKTCLRAAMDICCIEKDTI